MSELFLFFVKFTPAPTYYKFKNSHVIMIRGCYKKLMLNFVYKF